MLILIIKYVQYKTIKLTTCNTVDCIMQQELEKQYRATVLHHCCRKQKKKSKHRANFEKIWAMRRTSEFFLSTMVSIEHGSMAFNAPERGNCLHPTTLRLMFAKTWDEFPVPPVVELALWHGGCLSIIINASTIPTINIVQS